SEYHKWAIETFGSPELFFASIFCAQGSQKLSDMKVGPLKALFAEFLRLERYEAWADTSKQTGNILTGKAGGLEQRITGLEMTSGMRSHYELEYGAAGDKVAFLRDDRTLLQHELLRKRATVDILKATIQANALAVQRRADLQTQIDRLETELAAAQKVADAEISALGKKWRAIKQEIMGCDGTLEKRHTIEQAAENVRDIESGLTGLVATIEEENQNVPVYQKRCHDIETEIAGIRQQVKDLENDPALREINKKIGETELAIKTKKKEIQDIENDFQTLALQAEIKGIEKAALVGEGIDAECKSVICSAIKSVNEAKEKLPTALTCLENRQMEVKAERGKKETDLLSLEIPTLHNLQCDRDAQSGAIASLKITLDEQIRTATHDLKNAQTVLQGTTQLLTEHRKDLAAKRGQIEQQKALADRLPDIRIAESRKADLEKQLAEVEAAGIERKRAWAETDAAKSETIRGLRETMLNIIVDDEADTNLQAVQWDIKEIETVRIPAVEKEIQSAREKIATIQAELTRIAAAETELETVKSERDRLAAQAARWKYLQIACGKNGLQALEIDGAAPLISARANELLFLGYGPQFSVRIDTQDNEGREDLDIKVISEHGEDSLKMKSGGESVWLLHPIRLAMTLLSKEKGGGNWDFAAFDEITGALDSKGASDSFMRMYRPFMEIGQLRQIFYVTHQNECLAYADHKLCFENGKHPFWG
ncbi:MAG: hypothetical protein ABIJ57_12410, partial [Pseudomonadota bacterium]